MTVLQVTETVPIEPNHVYIIPPTKDLLMNDGSLQVVSAARPRGRHIVIDVFFRTLAEVHRERAVGIILSGAGSDWAVGIARIKERGGITIAQAPDNAQYDSMPRCAIQTNAVDLVLPAVEMPQKLIELADHSTSLQLPAAGAPEQGIDTDNAEAQAQAAEYALRDILHILHAQTGNDFKHYKRATVLRRIERRLQVNCLPNALAYRDFLRQHDEEAQALLQDMLISVTNFFRDRDAFEALERDVIPKIFSRAPETEQIRAWSVGCATGEEAYSLVMLLADHNALTRTPRAIHVFASDIDERAVIVGRRGLYPDAIVTDVPPSRLRQYFDKEEAHYCVKREIREKVLFATHNILRNPPFSRLHLITCRNATEIATVFIDRNMRIKRYSKPFTRLFNLIATDVSRSILDITCRLDYRNLNRDIEQVFEKLQPQEREVRELEDGAWYIARLLPYRTAEDRIEGLVLSFIDISKRKAAEERLQSSEQRMRLITASTRDYAIATMDMDGMVTSWNSGAERLFGFCEADILGQSAEILYTPEDREHGVFQDELRRARDDGRAEDERWHMLKNGSRVFCSGIASPLVDEKVCGYVKIARDLTDSKWARDQQDAKLAWEKQERIRAEEEARVRDEFFAVLSHELKQPLNLIQLTAEMMSRQREMAMLPAVTCGTATIKRMVEGQARIIDDLMDLSRLHTGKLTLTHTQINLSERISHVVQLMETEARQKGVVLQVDIAREDVIIQGDVVRIEQIVWNLLSNALKFTPAGGTVHIKLNQEGELVRMEVTDTGKGIAREFLPFIFDMFRQSNLGTTRQYDGWV